MAAHGAITAFGSVWVNGVEYSSANARILKDGREVPESELRVGMVVRVEGSAAARTAQTIRVDSPLTGWVEQVVNPQQWRVMGQLVQIEPSTRFESGPLPQVGDRVEVHGLLVAEGLVAAGYIERKLTVPTPPFEVKGWVRAHDPGLQRFQVGDLQVQYAAGQFSDMPAGSWNGLLVEVKGSACASQPVCGTLTAQRVQPHGIRPAEGQPLELEGYVAQLSGRQFMLGAQAVAVQDNTTFEHGSLDELANGAKVEVEGQVSGGVLLASKLSFRESIRLEGDVAALDSGRAELRLAGLAPLTLRWNTLTRWQGVADGSALRTGQHLRVRARWVDGEGVTASEISLRSEQSDPRVIVQGPVTQVAAPRLSLLGLDINTTGLADSDFRDGQEQVIGRAAFFVGLQVGRPVKLRGDWRNGQLSWKQAELAP
ncbi:hypothetical protein HNQ51_002469 [Inhella inkyongensis]|uniref:DUF5666 domain-containing protein n=1 Tax=Inhella inkyongensis TaxID=392593 RepID=A0A840S9S9_9BURK|nr:DUF5666 domain-containing protein [Inhella inkyongensis]MBB5205150.1 hypothetical protein [Inhella inkyongensis]